jgi:hypothetical protein
MNKSRGTQKKLLLVASLFTLSVLAVSCNSPSSGQPERPASAPSTGKTDTSREAEQIVEKYRSLDSSRDSTMRMQARIVEDGGSSRLIHMTVYRKLQPDGRRVMLVEFTAPSEERDRDALITLGSQGEIEATRYVQSNDSFVTTTSVLGEDSLFGMTLQELVDGQTEKYQYTLAGEETHESKPVYRIEGKLKRGTESKFPRIVLLISKENNSVLVAEFYDNTNELVRRVAVDRVEQVGNYLTRMKYTVDNRARQKKIEFETVSARYDLNISNAIFSREHLKKIATK